MEAITGSSFDACGPMAGAADRVGGRQGVSLGRGQASASRGRGGERRGGGGGGGVASQGDG
jgi:hypothetical protein